MPMIMIILYIGPEHPIPPDSLASSRPGSRDCASISYTSGFVIDQEDKAKETKESARC